MQYIEGGSLRLESKIFLIVVCFGKADVQKHSKDASTMLFFMRTEIRDAFVIEQLI